jgi:hypothetical protein
MGIGVSVFIMAVGAILAFAVERSVEGLDLDAVGVILMLVGAIGLMTSLVVWGPRTRRTTVIEDDRDVIPARRTYYREQV